MSVPYRTLPSDGDSAGFVPIPNPNATPRHPSVSLTTQVSVPATPDAPSTTNHIHFQRLDSPTAKPVGQSGQQLTSPSSQVMEVSTPGRVEAETSQSYINERGQKLHGNYRDPVPPNAKINGKTPLPPIPWVDERATAAPVVNSTVTDSDDEHDEDDDDEDDDEDDRRNKLSTNESKKTKAQEDHEHDDHEDEDDDDDDFGPHSDKPDRRPNKNKNEESEKHIMISDFKLTTDPSPDHHHDDEEPVTTAPQEATLARPKPSEQHPNHKEDDHEEDDDDDDEDFKESDFKYDEPPKPPPKPAKKKVPAKSPSQPQPKPAPQPRPVQHEDVDLGFTPAQPGELNLDDDDEREAQQDGYSPPDGFFSDDFGQDFDNDDGTFGKLDFDYDKFIKEMDAEKGIDGKVATLASSVDKAESVQSTHGKPREPEDGFFRDTGDSSKYSAPAKYPRMGYTGIPFSWDADERKKTPGKGKETGMYYDKYQAQKSPFGTESHRDMRYQKEGSRNEKTRLRPKGLFGSPFADPNFDFNRYVDTIEATTSTTTTYTPSSLAPNHAPSQENATHADEDEGGDDEEDDANEEPTRRSAELGNTVKGADARPRHKPKVGKAAGEPLAKNHRYETTKAARAKPAESTLPAAAAAFAPKQSLAKTPVQDYEDMVSEEDKRTPPKYPRSTERAIRSTTPLYYSTPHTTAYSTYPRQGPHIGEFAFEQPSSRNSLMYTPPPKAVPSFAHSVAKQRVVQHTTPAAVQSSSFSAYGPDALQHKFRQELGELQDSFRRPLFTQPSNHRTEAPQAARSSATKTTPRKATVKPKPKDDDMKEFFDVLGYTDEFKVENVHLAPTEAYDDLNPLKHIYPDIKAHIGLANDDDELSGAQRSTTSRSRPTPGRSRGRGNNQYQVFEDIAESRHHNRTTAPPSTTPNPVPFTRPNNRSHPESFRPPPPSNHKVTFHELTQTHPKTRHRALAASPPQQAARTTTTTASPPRQSNRLTTPRLKAPAKTTAKAALVTKAGKDSASRDATRDLTRTTPTPRRPDAGKKAHGYRYSNLQVVVLCSGLFPFGLTRTKKTVVTDTKVRNMVGVFIAGCT